MGGGYFQFFTENRPQKHKKHAILHTLQANGGARAPPRPPPWLRYWLLHHGSTGLAEGAFKKIFTPIKPERIFSIYNSYVGKPTRFCLSHCPKQE